MAYPSVTKKFTSCNKDTEAGTGFLNYAIFRQHSSRLGRFHMADPVHGSTSNPQSLNRFTYGLSDPINNIDPQGLFNVKVEIPADWPCNPADNVACGCDPFESPFCGIGGSYPPSSSGGGGGPTSCSLTMVVGSIPPAGYFCNRELSRATARLSGPFESVDPGSVKWTVKSRGSVIREGPGDFLQSNFSWYQDYRAYPSKEPSSITFTAKYSCRGGGASQPATGTLTINCPK